MDVTCVHEFQSTMKELITHTCKYLDNMVFGDVGYLGTDKFICGAWEGVETFDPWKLLTNSMLVIEVLGFSGGIMEGALPIFS